MPANVPVATKATKEESPTESQPPKDKKSPKGPLTIAVDAVVEQAVAELVKEAVKKVENQGRSGQTSGKNTPESSANKIDADGTFEKA